MRSTSFLSLNLFHGVSCATAPRQSSGGAHLQALQLPRSVGRPAGKVAKTPSMFQLCYSFRSILPASFCLVLCQVHQAVAAEAPGPPEP